MGHRVKAAMLGLAGLMLAGNVRADEDTFKVGFIDPLSGPAATAGTVGLKTWRFLVDEVNAQGGVDGRRFELLSYDNKLDPQETVVDAQKAIDAGARLIVRSNGSPAGIALSEFLNRNNARYPAKRTIYFDFSSTDPAVTNEKCSYWVIRWAADINMKVLAMANYLQGQPQVKSVYLLNGDYSNGQAVQRAVHADLTKVRGDVRFAGDELIPLMKVTDFAPYVEKIKASGADSVITSLWGQDLALFLKAAGQGGLKTTFYTFFAQGIGAPEAIRQSGLPPNSVYEVYETYANVPSPAYAAEEKAFRAAVGSGQTIMYPGAVTAMQLFARQAREAKSLDVSTVLQGLEDKHFTPLAGGDGWIRKDDHQVFQPLYIASFGPLAPGQTFDEENTGWGWRGEARIEAKDTVLPTTCDMRRPS